MQLRAQSDSDPLPASAASQSLDYWRNTASGISPESHSDEFRKNYSHMAGAHGNLLSHHGHTAAAEQTYQLSLQMYPRNIDSLINYHQFLLQNNRPSEATRLLDQFKSQHSDLVSELKKWLPPGD
jgi:predicted Zn-dependent protease